MRPPLSQGDIQGQPAREVGYYGGVRKGFEQARAGIEEVVQHLTTLLQKGPDNVRLERYIRQLTKLLEKLHKLQMRSSRVRDRRVEKMKPKEQGNFLQPGSPDEFDPHEDRVRREKDEMFDEALRRRTQKMPWPPGEG